MSEEIRYFDSIIIGARRFDGDKMNGRGGFREAQIVTPEYMDQFKPPEGEEEPEKGKKKKIPKSKDVPVKKIKPQKERFETEQEEKKIPLKEHKEKMDKLQQKYEKLEQKEASTRADNKTLKSDLSKMEKSYNSTKTKMEVLEANYKTLHDSYEKIDKELKALRKSGGDVSGELAAKDKEIESLNKEIKKKDKDIAALNSSIADAEEEIDGLKKEIEELKESQKETDVPEEERKGDSNVITRISETGFRSDIFTGTRYKVSLSRDCSYMTFKVDILVSARCVNNTIDLPKVSKYLPFNGTKDYTAESLADGSILIRL